MNSQTNLTVGDVTADEVEVEIRTPAVSITAGEKLTYYQIEDGVENLIGVFYAEAPTVATKTSIRFKAYDGKAKLAADFSEWLNANQDKFPMTLRTLVGYACEVAGVPLAADSFQFDSLSIPAFYAQGVTCRQIVSWAAQIAGRFVSCNTAGEIFFDWYRKTDISIGKTDFSQDGLSKKAYSTDLIKRVQFKQETNDVGVIYPADADGNVFSISRNGIAAVLDSDTLRTIAQYLYEKLKSVTYTPLLVKLPKRTAKIRAGDIISVTDGNGNTVSTYVMKVYLDGSGTQISSTGDQNYADKAAVSSEQYRNIPGKVLLLEKSVDGLIVENKDTAGRVAKLELSTEQITASVESVKKTSEEALEEAQKNATDLTNYANQVSGSLTDLQNQIDGAIETWFYDYEPTTTNAPASSWTTAEDKNKHLGDLFYIIDNKDKGGLVYRWALTNGVYGWVLVEDTEVAKALETASRAKDTADGKRRVFVTQPKPPYDVGDLWTNNTDLYVCQTARASGNYTASDWKLATEYTTKTAVQALIKVATDSITLRVESAEKSITSISDEVSVLKVTSKGVDMVSEDGNGKLVSFIGNRDGGGAWEAKYYQGGKTVSGLYFDFASRRFAFNGDLEITAENATRRNYTEQISISTDIDGTVYNGTGFKSGYGPDGNYNIISASKYKDYATTGFIPCKIGDTVRLKNITVSKNDNTTNFLFYNSNKEFIGAFIGTNTYAFVSQWGSTVDSSGNYTVVPVKSITLANGHTTIGAAYLRIVASGVTTDSIVTVNEDITETTLSGKLETKISGNGTWESKYTSSGEVVSGLYFDFVEKEFVFTGEIKGGSININNRFKVDALGNVTLPSGTSITWGMLPSSVASTSEIPTSVSELTNDSGYQTATQVTTITENTIATTNVVAQNLWVKAAHIDGTLSADRIKSGTLTSSCIEIPYSYQRGDVSNGTVLDGVRLGFFEEGAGVVFRKKGIYFRNGAVESRAIELDVSGCILQGTTVVDGTIKTKTGGISATDDKISFSNGAFIVVYPNNMYMGGLWTIGSGEAVTSDAGKKHEIVDLDERYNTLFDLIRPVAFKYNDGTSGRYHTGFIANEVEDALEKAGISTQEFAGFVTIDENNEDGTIAKTRCLRYEEFIAVLWSKVKQLEKKLEAMKYATH